MDDKGLLAAFAMCVTPPSGIRRNLDQSMTRVLSGVQRSTAILFTRMIIAHVRVRPGGSKSWKVDDSWGAILPAVLTVPRLVMHGSPTFYFLRRS